MRRALPNSHLRLIEAGRSCRAGWSVHRELHRWTRKQSTRSGGRNRFRRRPQICPERLSISLCPFASTSANGEGAVVKKIAAVVGLSLFCATAFAAAQSKKIHETCEQECKGNCSQNY